MQIVFICEEGRDRESERLSVQQRQRENDRRGWRRGKERKTSPERLRVEPAAPSQHSSSSLPVFFAMVTRQGSHCSQLMCFLVAGASGVLMCLSVSCTINVNCPGMHKHMEAGKPGNTRGRVWWGGHVTNTWKPKLSEKCNSVKVSYCCGGAWYYALIIITTLIFTALLADVSCVAYVL